MLLEHMNNDDIILMIDELNVYCSIMYLLSFGHTLGLLLLFGDQ